MLPFKQFINESTAPIVVIRGTMSDHDDTEKDFAYRGALFPVLKKIAEQMDITGLTDLTFDGVTVQGQTTERFNKQQSNDPFLMWLVRGFSNIKPLKSSDGIRTTLMMVGDHDHISDDDWNSEDRGATITYIQDHTHDFKGRNITDIINAVAQQVSKDYTGTTNIEIKSAEYTMDGQRHQFYNGTMSGMVFLAALASKANVHVADWRFTN